MKLSQDAEGAENVEDVKNPKFCGKCCEKTKEEINQRIPITNWLPKYSWKKNIVYDLLAGVTIACVAVPQGLAFASLANVDPIYGLNTACFSTFVYTLFGTAPISAFGPVAIGSMLTGESVEKLNYELYNFNKSQYVAALTVSIGICYIISFIFRLGVLTIIFKKPFVCGFIMACVLHILVKSFKQVFGLKTPMHYGSFSLYHNMYNIFANISDTNVPTLIVSLVAVFVLGLNMLVITPQLKKVSSFVIPIETIVMVVATLISYFCDLPGMGVPVIGEIPTGFPRVELPAWSAFAIALPESTGIALINLATTISVTTLFNPALDPEQEILAMGLSNLACGNLQCIVIGNSMMRTMVAVNLGIRSLLASVISSLLLLFIILFGGPLFEPLPTTILSCIILTAAVKLLYERIMDIRNFYKSFEDLVIFLVTLIVGSVFDVGLGMVVGIFLSLRKILDGVSIEEKKKKKEQEKALLEEEGKKKDEEMLLLTKDNKV